MHVVALSNIHCLNLFHPKYSPKTTRDIFVTKIKRGRKSKKDYGKALDKPITSQARTSTPKSSPEAAPKAKPIKPTQTVESTIKAPEAESAPIKKNTKKVVSGQIAQRKSSRILRK